jgi:hypothetical protein
LARGLAKAFTAMSNGEDVMKGITEATLIATSAITTFENTIEEVEDFVENFDPGPDSMAGIDFYDGAIESVQEMMDSFEYANP